MNFVRKANRLIRKHVLNNGYNNEMATIAKNNFWFIDIPRTSSTSLKRELGSKYGLIYGKNDTYYNTRGLKHPFPDHRTAQYMQAQLTEEVWAKMFTFTIVRNPWDRVVSLYYHRLKRQTVRQDLSFREYVLSYKSPRYSLKESVHCWPQFYYGAVDFIQDQCGNTIVDFVAKYESRNEDIKYIADKIGYPGLGSTSVNQSKPTVDYRTFYDEELMNIIKDVYYDDIKMFGYTFDPS